MRSRNQIAEDEDPNNSGAKKKKTFDGTQEHFITRGRIGIIMPERNAFDFTERPEKRHI